MSWLRATVPLVSSRRQYPVGVLPCTADAYAVPGPAATGAPIVQVPPASSVTWWTVPAARSYVTVAKVSPEGRCAPVSTFAVLCPAAYSVATLYPDSERL